MSNPTWKVSPYEPIRKLEDNFWLVEALIPDMPMPLKRIMSLFRLSDGRVVVHSAIALEEADMQQIEAWGEPSILVVPNGFHRIDAPRYKARYPKMTVLCPAQAHKKVEEKVAVDGHYDAFPADPAASVEVLAGNKSGEGVFMVRSGPARTRVSLVFNDTFFNQPHLPGFSGFLYRMAGQSGAPQVPLVARLLFVNKKQELRGHLERLAAIDGLVRVVPGHGEVIEGNAGEILKTAAGKL